MKVISYFEMFAGCQGGAATLGITTFAITTLSITGLSAALSINDTQHTSALTALQPYAEFRYAECQYADCHYADCRYAECRGAVRES